MPPRIPPTISGTRNPEPGTRFSARRASSFDLPRLRPLIKPFRLHWFPRLRSTNDYAAELRRRGELYAPAIVLTGHQTAGRGRGANQWWSSRGSLTVTFVFPVDETLAAHQLPLVAGLAVRDAAAELTGDNRIQLKWPNDVLFNNRKLGGLLCERVHKADLIGLGLNVNLDPAAGPAALRGSIASLREVAGRPIDLTNALAAAARHLHAMLRRRGEQPFATLLQDYDRHHALVGRKVRVFDAGEQAPISGRCEGLDSMGRLLLRGRAGLQRVIAGQVQMQ